MEHVVTVRQGQNATSTACLRGDPGRARRDFTYYTPGNQCRSLLAARPQAVAAASSSSMTVPDILKQVLRRVLDCCLSASNGTSSPRANTACSTAKPTSTSLSRLMEEEGIFYFFKHTDPAATSWCWPIRRNPHRRAPARPPTYLYERTGGGSRRKTACSTGARAQEIALRQVHRLGLQLRDAHQASGSRQNHPDSVTVGTVTHKLKVANDSLELYDYPGGYASRFDGIDKSGGEQPPTAEDLRRQQAHGGDPHAGGSRRQPGDPRPGVHAAFTAGLHFNLDAPLLRQRQVSCSPASDARRPIQPLPAEQRRSRIHYDNTFTCYPLALPFRPPRVTPVPSRARRADRHRGGPVRRRDLHRQVRPREGPVPLGPRGQERRQQLLLGSRRHLLGGQAVGRDPHPAHRPGSDRRFPGRRPRPAHHRRQRLQRRQMPPWTLPDRKRRAASRSRSSLQGGGPTISTRSRSKTRRAANSSASRPKKISRPW